MLKKGAKPMDEQSKLARLVQLYYIRFGKYPPPPQTDDPDIKEMSDKLSNAISTLIEIQDGEI